MAAGDRKSLRKGSEMGEGDHKPVEGVLGAAAYNERTSPHFVVDGCHKIH